MKKRVIAVALTFATIIGSTVFVGCSDLRNTDQKERDRQEKMLSEASRESGMPNIKNFFEKKTLKKILEMRDNPDLVCYAYAKSENSNKFIYLGKCVGYGIPYATQYTNPQKYSSGTTLPQADPNGLFSPTSADATWLNMIDEKTGEHHVMYFEPKVVVYQEKLPRRLVDEETLKGVDY